MKYAKVVNGQVVKYPYTLAMIKDDNPNTTFFSEIDEETMAYFNIANVQLTERPSETYDREIVEVFPVLINGIWTQQWYQRLLSPQEMLAKKEAQMNVVRLERNQKLAECDWTQLADSPLSDEKKLEWANYRWDLRNMPETTTDPFNPKWPPVPA